MTKTRSSPGGLLIHLQPDLPVPLYRQVEHDIRTGIRQGRLRPGSRMPSTRALAANLGVSRGVVVEAYQQLIAEGYLASRPGGYTEIATAASATPATVAPSATTPSIDFSHCRPDASQFPRAAWLRSIRRALNEAPHDRFNYLDGRGAPELHQALADYLNRMRGAAARPDNLIVCNGFTQGFLLLAQVLLAQGRGRLAIEDPSDYETRDAAVAAGLDVVGVPVDDHGIRIDDLERSGADTVLVTAAHQLPTGVAMSAESRTALVRWATRHDALVIEDDYDGEYRYDRAPIGAIQGLAPDHVVYAGTASKTLAPGLRLGWLVVPDRMVQAIASTKYLADRGSPALEQVAFADFVDRGEFDRHLRRMRVIYRRRRDILLDALAQKLPELRPSGISAGLHALAWLPNDLDEASVVDAAARRDLGVYGISPYRIDQAGGGGLIFGYAGLSERAIVEGIDLLADVITTLRLR